MDLYFDKDGTPLETEAWADKFHDFEYRSIARTEMPPAGYVSTVWLGIDDVTHAIWQRIRPERPRTPPLVFETQVFLPGTELHLATWRTPTEHSALAAHDQVCMEVRALLTGPGLVP